jgi:hypothetical protein
MNINHNEHHPADDPGPHGRPSRRGGSRCIIVIIAIPMMMLCMPLSRASAQWIEDPAMDGLIRTGISATYNIRFDAAEQSFQAVIRGCPAHPAGYFFDAMVDWWRILIDIEREDRDEAFYDKLDQVVGMCDALLKKNESDLTGLFFKGGAIGFRGRLRAIRKSWFLAASDGKEALPIVLAAAQSGRDNPDINLGTGIYNYYAAVLPEKNIVLKPLMLFLPKGDRVKGLRQLKWAAEKARYANWEAMYVLVQVFAAYENQPAAALPFAKRLCAAFPDNPVFQRSLAKLFVRVGDWSNTNRAYSDIIRKADQRMTGYSQHVRREALYYLGYTAMIRRDFAASMEFLLACDELSRSLDTGEPSGFMVMTNLRMGMLHDILNERNYAVKQYDKVLRMNDYNDSHELAERYRKTPYKMD